MAAKNERAQIELFAPAAPEGPGPTVSARFEEATLRLARLIGRQIAREEFERRHQRKNAKEAAEIKIRGKSPRQTTEVDVSPHYTYNAGMIN